MEVENLGFMKKDSRPIYNRANVPPFLLFFSLDFTAIVYGVYRGVEYHSFRVNQQLPFPVQQMEKVSWESWGEESQKLLIMFLFPKIGQTILHRFLVVFFFFFPLLLWRESNSK
jgi:hypothetical protein